MKLIFLYNKLCSLGGAQKVIIELLENFANMYDVYLSSFSPTEQIHRQYFQFKKKYIPLTFKNLKYFKNATVISGHRKTTTILYLLSFIYLRKIKIIHFALTMSNSKRRLTFLGNNIIAISDAVKQNLINYFHIAPEKITVIQHGVKDRFNGTDSVFNYGKAVNRPLSFLYLGRVDDNKRQVDVAQALANTDLKFKLIFVGTGPRLDELKTTVANDKRFSVLGEVKDVNVYLYQAHFTLLMSKHEGLPLSLVESLMSGVPIIANDIISLRPLIKNNNGFLVNDISELLDLIKMLNSISLDDYRSMVYAARAMYKKKFSLSHAMTLYTEYIKNRIES